MSRRSVYAISLAALLACGGSGGGGGPAGPDPQPNPDPPPGASTDLVIEWDGGGVSWGEPVTLTAVLGDGVEGDVVEWVSLEDHWNDLPVVLGRGAVLTTQALRPGETTVEARLLEGGAIVARATVDVRVAYRESWRMVVDGRHPFPDGTTGDVWVAGGHAYVARRGEGGISVVNLAGMNEVGRFDAPTLFTQDVKVSGGVAYVSHEPREQNQYARSVTTLDASDPSNLRVLGGVPITSTRSAHNLFVDGDLMAVTSGGQFDLYDVSDPANPVLSGFVESLNGSSHDVHLRNGRLYGAFLSSSVGPGELTVADVSNPGSPVVLSRVQWENSFTHSSWLSADGRYLYVCDERVNAPIRIVDVSNPGAARVVATYQPRLGTVPHNIQVFDDRLAFLAHYKHGVEVVDVSDPVNPRLVGFYDTHPGAANDDMVFSTVPSFLRGAHEQSVFEGAWGVHWDAAGRVVVSDMQSGLWVFRFVGGG